MSLGTVISFCDVTGNMVEPWLEAGFDCCIVDIQHPRGKTKSGRLTKVGAHIEELYRGHWWLPESACINFGAPDCTWLTNSANRWQRERGPGPTGRGLLHADAVWRLQISYECPWMLENPRVGRLATSWCKPDQDFHPWEYAGYLDDVQTDNTSKWTGLWTGNGFVMPEKRPAPEPHREDCFRATPGEDRADIRSMTPKGFARAVYEANGLLASQFGRYQKSVNGGCPELRQHEDAGRRGAKQDATDRRNGNRGQLSLGSQLRADATPAKDFVEETILATDHGHTL